MQRNSLQRFWEVLMFIFGILLGSCGFYEVMVSCDAQIKRESLEINRVDANWAVIQDRPYRSFVAMRDGSLYLAIGFGTNGEIEVKRTPTDGMSAISFSPDISRVIKPGEPEYTSLRQRFDARR